MFELQEKPTCKYNFSKLDLSAVRSKYSKEYKTSYDFGFVTTGKKYQKIFQILNDTGTSQTYSIKRDPEVNPIYQAFDFSVYSLTVPPDRFFQVKITFLPITPHTKYMDDFHIIDGEINMFHIHLKGECTGPHIHASVDFLKFYVTATETVRKHIFELKNISDTPTQYQFDVNESDDIFKIDNVQGTLKPRKHSYVTVWFKPKERRQYSGKLTCLLLYQEPFTIKLYGLYDPTFDFPTSAFGFLHYPQDLEETVGYFGYMSDTLKVRNSVPLLSLSQNYLDFGRVDLKAGEISRTLTTSLTNHMNADIEIEWDNIDESFKILPKCVLLPEGESVLYECMFIPKEKDNFFSKTLIAQVYWKDHRECLSEDLNVKYIFLPAMVFLRVSGDSFPEDKRWIPNVEIIPPVVILPPTIPNYPVYSTFILKSSGRLPVAFKFIPPLKTNFVIKPMLGLIKHYQIVMIQLQPDGNEGKTYLEYWEVQLNGRKENCKPFYVKCYSSLPSISIGVHNYVNFDCIQVDCIEDRQVVIRNTSVHYLEYNFITKDLPFLTIDYPTGRLSGNEKINITWHMHASLDLPQEFTVICELRCLQNAKRVIGGIISVPVKCAACYIFTKLCAIPNSFDFGVVKYSSMETTKFNMFNFGEPSIHFQLKAVENGELLASNELSLSPEQGTVLPKANVVVILNLSGKVLGEHTVDLIYYYRKKADSHEYSCMVPEKIFTLTYTCIYPTLQIVDITSHSYAPNFSKVALWKSLNIDAINDVLEGLKSGETTIIQSQIPDYQVSPATFKIDILLSNMSTFKCGFNLKRIKVCECRKVQITKGISFRTEIYDCKHRNMFRIEFCGDSLEGLSSENLRLLVNYTEASSNTMVYKIMISENRSFEWHIYFNALMKGTAAPSIYEPFLFMNLKMVNLGIRDAPVQGFHFYNDTDNEVTYDLDVTQLDNVKSIYEFPILQCLEEKNLIAPFSSGQILFKFSPIYLSMFSVNLPITIGSIPAQLTVQGKGCKETCVDLEKTSSIPVLPYSANSDCLVTMSLDELVIDEMVTWSVCERMVFIKNLTKNKIIGYSWETRDVPGVFSIKTHCRKGILQPKESHSIMVQIKSFDIPCDLHVNLPCKLLDHNQHYEHLKSFDAYQRKEKELEGQFTITEFGTVYPKNDVVIVPDVELKFISLDLWIKIASVFDRDILLPLEAQLVQSPQFILKPSIQKILDSCDERYNLNQVPITSFAIDKMKVKERKSVALNFDFVPNMSKTNKNVDFYKYVGECLLADVLQSEMFHDIVMKKQDSPSPFYTQFRFDSEDIAKVTGTNYVDNARRKHFDNLCRHNNIQNYLNRPQPLHSSEIMVEAIKDGIHEAFQLGPQKKDDIYSPDELPDLILKYACGCKEGIMLIKN